MSNTHFYYLPAAKPLGFFSVTIWSVVNRYSGRGCQATKASVFHWAVGAGFPENQPEDYLIRGFASGFNRIECVILFISVLSKENHLECMSFSTAVVFLLQQNVPPPRHMYTVSNGFNCQKETRELLSSIIITVIIGITE